MRILPRLVVGLFVSALFSFTLAQTCQTWTGRTLGHLNGTTLPEASGLAVSTLVDDRFYVMSDSDSPNLYLSNFQGSELQHVRIGTLSGRWRDVEDLAVGPCGLTSCLFMGDIGGNNVDRDWVDIIVLEELKTFPERVEPIFKLKLLYPDGAQDAEGLAVHPNGDIYVLSKEMPGLTGVAPAKLYRTRATPWLRGDEPLPLVHVATIHLRELSGSFIDLFSHTATAMDISPDGLSFMLLTYGDAFEINLDLSTLPEGQVTTIDKTTPFQKVPVERLAQQEGLAYLRNERSFIYTTEARGKDSPIVQYSCEAY